MNAAACDAANPRDGRSEALRSIEPTVAALCDDDANRAPSRRCHELLTSSHDKNGPAPTATDSSGIAALKAGPRVFIG